MPDPSREDLDRFQAALGERSPGEPLWIAVDRATQAALMSLGDAAAGVAGAITRLVTEFERSNGPSPHGHGGGSSLVLDAIAIRRVAEAYLRARHELTQGGAHTTELNLPFLTADETGPKHMRVTIAGADLAALEQR